MNPTFIHLKCHTEYSLVDSIVSIDALAKTVVDMQMPAIAITDRMNLFGLVKFYKQALQSRIKPIIGSDLLIRSEKSYYLITALCKNEMGYRHLRELISKAYLEGQLNGQIAIMQQWLEEFREGLIILSGGRQGDIGKAILANDMNHAASCLQRWTTIFPNHFYLELQRTNREGEEIVNQTLIELAEQYQTPVVATNDVRFLHETDFEAHEARVCIQTSRVLNDLKRPKNYSEKQYLRTSEEMIQLFSDIPEAIENTEHIAKRCTIELTLGHNFLPQFPVPKDISVSDYLSQQSQTGLDTYLLRRNDLSEEKKTIYQVRLCTELDVIHRMKFDGYFLIVADFIQWAKEQNIPVGPGRGSGAGSLVAFCLGITALDPIEHELLFERFLNPERISMPDFDIDFCMDQRDRVIDYVAHRYGRDAVSQIITYGTMAARAVVRDVGRVLGYPYGFVDKIAKLIPFEIGMTLEKALKQEQDLAKLCTEDSEVMVLMELAKKLEGLVRNAGKHAGGVVIAPTKITDFAPLYCESGSTQPVTQFDKDDVEAVGLVKFDFLGLRTLTIIQWAINAINQKRQNNNELPIDIHTIPLNDIKTFELLKNCSTTAIFQLESRGMKELVRRLQPDCFEEITALVALFRPGPLQSGMVDDFINCKHGREAVHYFHPNIEYILKPTYGVILYQEQVMQIAQVLAGYSLGAADLLRRAMGKKKPEEMEKQREIFLKGAVSRGVTAEIAERIFDVMEKFAGYGFNKSHSAAYALLSYQTAWLKAHYPAEFMAAVLSSDMDHTDKVVGFYRECSAMGLTVLPPNINQSFYQFTVNTKGELTYGLGAIKGVGEAAALHLVEEREKNGIYRDLFDFCRRVDLHKISRRTLEPLVRSGTMDVFGMNRDTLFASIHRAILAAEQCKKNNTAGQTDLFGSLSEDETALRVDYCVMPEGDLLERFIAEKETLGLYLSGHPIKIYENEIRAITTCSIDALSKHIGKKVIIAGLLENVKKVITKRGNRMGILTLADRTGQVEVTLFNKLYETTSSELEKNEVFVVIGNVEEDPFNHNVRMIAESIEHLDSKRAHTAKRILIFADLKIQLDEWLSALPAILQPFAGGACPVLICYQNNTASAKLQLGDAWRVTPKNALLSKLKQLCGEEQVKVEY